MATMPHGIDRVERILLGLLFLKSIQYNSEAVARAESRSSGHHSLNFDDMG